MVDEVRQPGDVEDLAVVRGQPAAERYLRDGLAEARRGPEPGPMTHLKEAARRFAAVDVGDAPRPEIWTLVEW
jgi:hypothetical protein